MWKIKPTSGKYNCFSGPIISYAEGFNIDYQVGLLTGWGFVCSDNSYVPTQNGILLGKILKQIHGIFLDKCEFSNKNELLQLLSNELPIAPVMISVDAIDCPWCLTHGKYSMLHYLLILGMKNEIIYCIDSYFPSDGVVKWDISKKSWAGECITFKTEKVAPEKKDYIFQLNNVIEHVRRSDMINELIKYRDTLVRKDSFSEEISLYHNDYYAMPILIAFQHLYMHRYNNASAIKYIGEKLHKEELFSPAVDAFIKTGNCYEKMKSSLIKQIITNKLLPTKIQENMNAIIESETTALEILEKIVNSIK